MNFKTTLGFCDIWLSCVQQGYHPAITNSWTHQIMTHISIKSGNTKIDQSITFSLKTWPISCSHRIFWGVSGSHRVLRGSHRIFWGVSSSHRVLRGSHSLGWPRVGTLANGPTGRRLLAPQSARLALALAPQHRPPPSAGWPKAFYGFAIFLVRHLVKDARNVTPSR